MKKVLCFGEILLRITPDRGGEWLDKNSLPFYLGGAEANVASALSCWDIPVKYMTALPDNDMSVQVVDYLNRLEIDTTAIKFMGDRIGIYYLSQGAGLQDAGVIYDRSHSSFSELKPGTIDWDSILTDISWVHFSAICPAINKSLALICEELLLKASSKNIPISLDLNYRSKLWNYGEEPIDIMPKLARHASLIMGNIWAANKMLGIALDDELIKADKSAYLEHSLRTSEAIMKSFPACKAVANTFRFDNQKGIRYYCTLYAEEQFLCSKEYSTNKPVNRVGSGDCFMAGLIYGFLHDLSISETLEYATAAAFDKLFISSDSTSSSVVDIQKAMHKLVG